MILEKLEFYLNSNEDEFIKTLQEIYDIIYKTNSKVIDIVKKE